MVHDTFFKKEGKSHELFTSFHTSVLYHVGIFWRGADSQPGMVPKNHRITAKILDSECQLRIAQTRRMLRSAWVPDPVGMEQSAD